MPGDADSAKVKDVALNGSSTLSFTDGGAAGDPTVNHYYVVRGVNACGGAAAPAARSGELCYGLVR